MTAWKGPAAWAKKEQSAGDRLPYVRHIDDRTLLLRDGSLMQALHITGIAFETEDAEQLNHYQAVRETVMRSALDERFIVYHHVIRRKIDATLNATYEDPFAGALDSQWRKRLAERSLFVNELFITLVRRPPRGKIGWPERLLRWTGRLKDKAFDPAARRDLDAARSALVAAFQPYGIRELSCYDGPAGRCSEILELLSALYNGEMRPVHVPVDGTDLGHFLPYVRSSFGLDAVELRAPDGSSFVALLSMKDYPSDTRPGALDTVLRLSCAFVLTESFAPAARQVARERIDLAIRRLKAADDDGRIERRDLMQAKDAVVSGQTAFGEHHLTLAIKAESLVGLDQAAAQASAAMADFGAISVREDVNLEPAFWAQFPGNESFIARKALISTANIAGLVSLHGFPVGMPEGTHWGQAITVFETTSATPYYFSFHEADLGNFTVIGPSGSGKTVVMNFLAAQAQKVAPRTICFDKDRGAEIFIRAIGGHYTSLQPGLPTGFNPLMLPDTATNRAFLRDWLACLLMPPTGTLSTAEIAVIAAAVDANFEQDTRLRRLRYFRELLGGVQRPEDGDLASRLLPWTETGAHGWLFDNAEDRLDLDRRIAGFDMTALLESAVLRTPAMMYLFHRIDLRLDGEPTMILIDEGWKALDAPIFAARIRDWMKTLRKRNAIIGIGTQSARDALDSSVASAIVEQTATQIFMPNSRARADDYCRGFGLTAHELELIRAIPAHSHCFLIRRANHSVVARLDLSGMPEILIVLSGRESTVRKLDAIRARVGDDPAAWYHALTGMPWPGAPAAHVKWLEAAE